MFNILTVITVIFVAVAMALSLAHTLELPGKMRLDKETYYAIQPIYYPGFTIGGISEPVSIILIIILLLFTPTEGTQFWLTLTALMGIIGMQVVYWLFTHPVNQFWVEGAKLSDIGSSFFAFGMKKERPPSADWLKLRDQWEYSHVARAGFALISLIALVIAISIKN
ncbi:MAG TPA: hypothetical protein V6D19_14890 [Stenomitos sp.]